MWDCAEGPQTLASRDIMGGIWSSDWETVSG